MPEIQLVSDAASNWGGWSGSVLESDRVWPGTSKRAAAASSVAGCPAERRTSIDPRNSATLTCRSTTATSNTVPCAVIDPPPAKTTNGRLASYETSKRARSEERSVGKEWVSTCRSRGARFHKKKKKKK